MRKEKIVEVPFPGRDQGKVFHLREWPTSRAENWGLRSVGALTMSGRPIPEVAKHSGMAAIALVGLDVLTNADSDVIIGLLNELMECVQFEPSPGVKRGLIEDDIEEVQTRLWLKVQVFELHVGFSAAELKGKLTSAAKNYLSSITLTAPGSSEHSYRGKRRR